MRNMLSHNLLQTAANWSQANNIPQDQAKELLATLTETMARMGVVLPPGRVSKMQKKQLICDIIKTEAGCSIRKIKRLLGYKSERSIAVMLDELRLEGRVSYDKENGWSVNESQD